MKLGKKTKIGFVIIALIVIIGGIFVMRKKAEEYILREARIGLKIYFEKYYNGIDSNSIKMEIKYHHMVSGPYIKGYANGDKDLSFNCEVIKLPENKWKTYQDELGMVITRAEPSGALGDMLKYKYSFNNPNRKGEEKRPSELIPKSEIEKAKKDRYLLEFIPEMMSY